MSEFTKELITISYFIGMSFILAFLLLGIVYLMTFNSKVEYEKSSAYECGFQPFSETNYPFEVQFALIAILFLLFDIEILFIYPLCTSILEFQSIEVFYLTIFFVIVTIGLLYEISRHIVHFFDYEENINIHNQNGTVGHMALSSHIFSSSFQKSMQSQSTKVLLFLRFCFTHYTVFIYPIIFSLLLLVFRYLHLGHCLDISSFFSCIYLCIPLRIQISHRFYPGNIEVKSTSKFMGNLYKGSFTVPTKHFNLLLDNHKDLQKCLAYLTYFIQNKHMGHYYLLNNVMKLKGYFDPTKNNILISTINNDNILINSSKSTKALETSLKDDNIPGLFNLIFDDRIPCVPMMKLYILERLQIKTNCSRGLIHQYLINHIYNENNHEYIKILNQIYVENASGPGDFNFALELSRNFEHLVFLNKFMSTNFKTEKLTLLHKNLPNSVDAQKSLFYTGQSNCDTKLNVIINNNLHFIYMDTKQTNMSEKDFTRSYLKITYQIKSFNIDQNDVLEMYVEKSLKILQEYDSDTIVKTFFDEISGIKNPSFSYLANQIHKFILLNHDKPYGRMAVILQQEIGEGMFHHDCLILIANKDIEKFNSQVFSIDNKKALFNAYQEFEKTDSATRLYHKFKEQFRTDNNKIMNEWSKYKNIPHNNNDDIDL